MILVGVALFSGGKKEPVDHENVNVFKKKVKSQNMSQKAVD